MDESLSVTFVFFSKLKVSGMHYLFSESLVVFFVCFFEISPSVDNEQFASNIVQQ